MARRYRTTNATVGKWRERFIERRLEGSTTSRGSGAPRTISDEAVEAVIVKTLETTPKGETHWSTRTMAAKAGMSHTMIGRIWRTFGLQAARHAVVQDLARSRSSSTRSGTSSGCT